MMLHENIPKKEKGEDPGHVKTIIFQIFRAKVHVLLNVLINKTQRQ